MSVTEEGLLAKRLLVSAVGFEVLISKKGYVEPLRSLANEVQAKLIGCEATKWQLDMKNAQVEESELKVGLLVDEAGKVGKIQRRLDAHPKELESTKRALQTKKADMKKKTQDYGRLQLELR